MNTHDDASANPRPAGALVVHLRELLGDDLASADHDRRAAALWKAMETMREEAERLAGEARLAASAAAHGAGGGRPGDLDDLAPALVAHLRRHADRLDDLEEGLEWAGRHLACGDDAGA